MTRIGRSAIFSLTTLGVLLATGAVATLDAWTNIFEAGRLDLEQSHVLLAVPLAAWIFWLRRARLRQCEMRHRWVAIPVLIGALLLSRVGLQNGWDIFWHLGAILVAFSSIIGALGLRSVVVFLPVFGALLFALPVPGFIRQHVSVPLQSASAATTEALFELVSVPVARAGNVLEVNGNSVAVAEACNGMRLVSALALVAYAFIFSVPMRGWVRVLLLGISPLLALVVNILRLVPSALFYGYGTADNAKLFHDLSGWGAMGVALALIWGILALLRWLEVPVTPLPHGAHA